ncbi:MAG: hypothetical protein ACKO27_07775 [Ilumatobacteraceae bacterium]
MRPRCEHHAPAGSIIATDTTSTDTITADTNLTDTITTEHPT